MMSFSFMSNGYVVSILYIYFSLVHTYYVQYYFYEIGRRITAMYTSTNKFGTSFVLALFMSVSVVASILLNIETAVNHSGAVVFISHILNMSLLFFMMGRINKFPSLIWFVLFNAFVCGKELLYRMTLQLSNSYLNAISNIMSILIFSKLCIGRLFPLNPVQQSSRRDLENLRFGDTNNVSNHTNVQQNYRVRRIPNNITNLEIIPFKEYVNPFFLVFEVIFDNLFVYQHSKERMHVLDIRIRAIISPIIFMILNNIVFEITDIVKYLALIAVGILIGLINFICIRKTKFFKFLTFYNLLLTILIEAFLIKQVSLDQTVFNNKKIGFILIEILNNLQISIPAMFLTIKCCLNGMQGLVTTANIISYSMILLSYTIISNIVGIVEKLQMINEIVKVGIVFQLLSAVFPYLMCMIYKRNMTRMLGLTTIMFVPFYYLFINWLLTKNK